MSSPRSFWPGYLAAGVTYQLLALRRHDNSHLSACVRDLYRVHTTTGRVALVVSWTALTAWLLPHWCRAVDELVTAIEEATP